ncbi:hypothetical protein SUGI_0140450 [Cryptomeria japonica]|uniref:protein ROOT HAIR DEFECTIVE 3 n=1 Tax=Cryptomeria japonica TaxID=3369 RepID=UPI002408E5C1|nr:protein ROOT HAIR DEFECTIVE 3 [Cryptomeria japonica]XP_057844957.1 protein ROOT HAIR DEFECTIVE 3 [Cryptomeria japonica]XP_057844958.1 protein ROOT HAIR DEFECTIVE 3 [Cryptomeria japonica]XP_057844959.1 protein ROOT HAIR DEFECTIVE 3 [Cryptomeria japonica]XP_057844960.1 protein ROOT HAIR DEFECTIVE 3 [Cryptomeria japonica]XP_057844961.1 protein ROOT HAIR DEFECTIVE 3 [Cryptomeria japonica]XP_057844963.1 protein ROOT HAIR DEFECTIVE 3 [Cryptomeria japonica]XP_057844964.1 protein ROOT HAIR DEFECT
MSGEAGCSIQLIDGKGQFNDAALNNLVKAVKLAERGLSYAVVSIMGPQSSGKSTLLNHLFHTNFREMDAFMGRSQTTQGIWLSQAVGIEPCTLVMDLEGTDGRERGEDDTTFEKQSSLFALAVSDIVLINMWCHDIGREQAANKPLLKTVFQVMMRLFSPRRTTLLFVIRDKTKTPLEVLEPILREDIQKIWNSVPKPPKHRETPLSEFFNVEVTALSSYEEKEELFKEQVAFLRERFFNSITPGGLAGDRRAVVPASGFPFSIQQIWKIIKENRDLDLPAHKVMVATVRCEEIAKEKVDQLSIDEGWRELEELVQSRPVKGFGRKLSTILDKYLSSYDAEVLYFDESVRTEKRQQLVTKSLDLVYPAYQAMLGHLRSDAFNRFKNELEEGVQNGEGFAAVVQCCTKRCLGQFDQECADAKVQQANWDSSKTRYKLQRDIDSHAASVQAAKLSEIKKQFEMRLNEDLAEPVASLLEAAAPNTWPEIRKLLQIVTERAASDFTSVIAGFEIDDVTSSKMVKDLKDYGRSVVEKKAREEAGQVLILMKERFSSVFSHDADSMPRVWTGKEDIRAITKDARSASLKLLAVMAAIRLDEEPDMIEATLSSTLTESADAVGSILERSVSTPMNALASSTWEGVPPSNILITPVQCKSLWRQFKSDTEYTVSQALAAQEAKKKSSSWLPPPWAILAIFVLGFNEFMLLLRNPLYIGVLFVLYLLGRALWVQLDIPGEFNHGILPGILSLSTKFLPTVMNLLRKLADEGHNHDGSRQSSNNPDNSESSGNGNLNPVLSRKSTLVSSHASSSDGGLEYSSSIRRRSNDGVAMPIS